MNLKKRATLLVVVTLNTIIAASGNVSEHDSRLKVQSSVARSNNFVQGSSSRSLQCFYYYIPYIEELNRDYQREYEACKKNSMDGYSKAEAATVEQRNELAALASWSCYILSECIRAETAQKVFQCFAKEALENTKVMHRINDNALENLSDLQEELRLVDQKEYKCTNDTQREHEKKIMQAYQDLDKCVAGKKNIPTKTAIPQDNAAPIETSSETTDPKVIVIENNLAKPKSLNDSV